MFKRVLSLLIVFLLTASTTYAEQPIMLTSMAVACPDHFVEITDWTGEIEYRPYSLDEHKCYDVYIGICYTCESVERVGMYKATYPHSWLHKDDGHVEGKLLHRRVKLCPVCGYTILEFLNCPGPENGGCIVTMDTGSHQEEQ